MIKRTMIHIGFAAAICSVLSYAYAQTSSPSFDCSKASGQVEKLVCADEGLAALDRNLAAVYTKAAESWPSEEAAAQRAMQRGWISGRIDCWKADDVNACVELAYRTRTVELQIFLRKAPKVIPVNTIHPRFRTLGRTRSHAWQFPTSKELQLSPRIGG